MWEEIGIFGVQVVVQLVDGNPLPVTSRQGVLGLYIYHHTNHRAHDPSQGKVVVQLEQQNCSVTPSPRYFASRRQLEEQFQYFTVAL